MSSNFSAICGFAGCGKIFERPIVLPCCKELMCEKHLKLQISKNKSASCPFCNDSFDLPKEGLPIDSYIDRISKIGGYSTNLNLKQKLIELYFESNRYEEFKKNADTHLYDYFNEIINEIDINGEEWILRIDNYYDKMITDIDKNKKTKIFIGKFKS